jgi:competence protein ComGC
MKSTQMKRVKGLTIIQMMLILLIAGILGSVVVNLIIDKRCEADPAKQLCIDRTPAKRP